MRGRAETTLNESSLVHLVHVSQAKGRERGKIKIENLIILLLFGFQALSRWDEEWAGLTLLIIILIIVSTFNYCKHF